MVLSGGSSSCLSANLREGPLLRICIRGASPNLPCAKQQGTKSFIGSVTVSRKPSGEADLRGGGGQSPTVAPRGRELTLTGRTLKLKERIALDYENVSPESQRLSRAGGWLKVSKAGGCLNDTCRQMAR